MAWKIDKLVFLAAIVLAIVVTAIELEPMLTKAIVLASEVVVLALFLIAARYLDRKYPD